MMASAGPSSQPPGLLPQYSFIDSEDFVAQFIDKIIQFSECTPTLYIDLEGVNLLSRPGGGTVSVMQILVDEPQDYTYLIDVYKLGRAAFLTTGYVEACNLRDILESPGVDKVVHDVRRVSFALYGHFDVRLEGVRDLQLMEVAVRLPAASEPAASESTSGSGSGSKRSLRGLAACIERDYPWWHHGRDAARRRREWIATKNRGRELVVPACGGRYRNLIARPMPRDLVAYCLGNVVFLPSLFEKYSRLLLLRQGVGTGMGMGIGLGRGLERGMGMGSGRVTREMVEEEIGRAHV